MRDRRASGVWRLLRVPPRGGAENMARDAGLLDRARETGETVFSVYGWESPTLSLGRNQTARGMYDTAEAARRGIGIVRRPTGGRALLHHREVTYSVTAPVSDGESQGDSYSRFNAILIEGLRQLGVDAREAPAAGRMEQPGTLPCFAAPAEGELTWNGAKLAGSAQVREDGALLQHGSILVEDDQHWIAALLAGDVSGGDAPRAATLREALGLVPSLDQVADALFRAVKSRECESAASLSEADVAGFTSRYREKYASEWWTWRR